MIRSNVKCARIIYYAVAVVPNDRQNSKLMATKILIILWVVACLRSLMNSFIVFFYDVKCVQIMYLLRIVGFYNKTHSLKVRKCIQLIHNFLLVSESWIDLHSQCLHSPGRVTPPFVSAGEEYLRLLREAQRDSNQSSARVSRANSNIASLRGR